MKTRILTRFCIVILAAVLVFCLSGCEEFIEALKEIRLTTPETVSDVTPGENATEEPSKEGGRLFTAEPKVDIDPLPVETISDPVEKEASDIIDNAIAAGIAYVNAMKDSRHSYKAYDFDVSATMATFTPTETEIEIHDIFINDAYAIKESTVTDKTYGDLKETYFGLYDFTMWGYDPFITCFYDIDVKSTIDFETEKSHYHSIFTYFYDAYKSQNTRLSATADHDKIKHDMDLFSAIVKRVVKFMPEGLTAYDKYYYLAVVLSEHVSYDDRPENCFTAFGALVQKKAVCEGISLAYMLLCKEANLWCTLRTGVPSGSGHQWNMIKLESGIYNVDVTWSDVSEPNSYTWYKNFIKTDEYFDDLGHAASSGIASTGTGESNPYED